jgi:hypothetical protein
VLICVHTFRNAGVFAYSDFRKEGPDMSDEPSIQEQKYNILLESYADLFEEVQKFKTWVALMGMLQAATVAALTAIIFVQ